MSLKVRESNENWDILLRSLWLKAAMTMPYFITSTLHGAPLSTSQLLRPNSQSRSYICVSSRPLDSAMSELTFCSWILQFRHENG